MNVAAFLILSYSLFDIKLFVFESGRLAFDAVLVATYLVSRPFPSVQKAAIN